MAFSGPFNINDQANLYGSKRKNLNADLHHNKNHDIFSDGYSSLDRNRVYEAGMNGIRQSNQVVSNNSFEGVNDSVGISYNRSPSLRKNKIVG